MKTLFFLQSDLSIENELSYWIVGIIFIVCVLYMAVGVFIVYRITYKEPKKQSKWLKNKYSKNSN